MNMQRRQVHQATCHAHDPTLDILRSDILLKSMASISNILSSEYSLKKMEEKHITMPFLMYKREYLED